MSSLRRLLERADGWMPIAFRTNTWEGHEKEIAGKWYRRLRNRIVVKEEYFYVTGPQGYKSLFPQKYDK